VTLPRLLALLVLAIACAHALIPQQRESGAVQDLLTAAVERSVARLGREGGFAEEPAARIDLALRLGPLGRALHGLGMGTRVALLEAALERASERATAELGPWLGEEAARFAPEAPDAVLRDPPGAAALAFRAAVEPDLAARLRPAAERAVEEAGVAAAMARVREGGSRLPLPREVSLDPVALVSERVRAAFFTVLVEETALRADASDAAAAQGFPPTTDDRGAGERAGRR